MARAIDKALRRELISLAAERLWRRQGVRRMGSVLRVACPTCGSWSHGRPASWRQPSERLAAEAVPVESRAAAGESS